MKLGQLQWFAFWLSLIDSKFFILWIITLFFTNMKGRNNMLTITTIDNKIKEVDDWKSIKEPIIRMSLQINEKQAIVLEGFESYLRIKEMYKGVNCKLEGMSKIILFGYAGLRVAVVEIDCRTGKVMQEVKKKGFEYNNKPLQHKHLKRGIFSIPRIYVND